MDYVNPQIPRDLPTIEGRPVEGHPVGPFGDPPTLDNGGYSPVGQARTPVPEQMPPAPGQMQVSTPDQGINRDVQQHPCVVIMRVPTGEEGKEEIKILELNGIDTLSVPVLLRIAANIREQQLGL